jgi:hypothetical protein
MKIQKRKTNSTIADPMKEAHAAELETVENHLANSVGLDGLGAREVAESLADDVTEQLGHATKLARRLKPQGVLFTDGGDRHHHAVVTNLSRDGAKLRIWGCSAVSHKFLKKCFPSCVVRVGGIFAI